MTVGYTYDAASRLIEDDLFTYAYDPNGNTTRRVGKADGATVEYDYDSDDRLIAVREWLWPGGGTTGTGTATPTLTAIYVYDPFGRRIEKTVNGVTTNYAYDGNNIVAEYGAGGTLIASYTHPPGSIDHPLSMTRAGQTFYYVYDGNNNVVALTNEQGEVVQTYEYDAFGRITLTMGNIANPFTYTGREYDPETNLYFYRARTYDPEIGRFLQEDPVFSMNAFAYTGSNPVNSSDPLGLYRVPVSGDPGYEFYSTHLDPNFNPGWLNDEYVEDGCLWQSSMDFMYVCYNLAAAFSSPECTLKDPQVKCVSAGKVQDHDNTDTWEKSNPVNYYFECDDNSNYDSQNGSEPQNDPPKVLPKDLQTDPQIDPQIDLPLNDITDAEEMLNDIEDEILDDEIEKLLNSGNGDKDLFPEDPIPTGKDSQRYKQDQAHIDARKLEMQRDLRKQANKIFLDCVIGDNYVGAGVDFAVTYGLSNMFSKMLTTGGLTRLAGLTSGVGLGYLATVSLGCDYAVWGSNIKKLW